MDQAAMLSGLPSGAPSAAGRIIVRLRANTLTGKMVTKIFAKQLRIRSWHRYQRLTARKTRKIKQKVPYNLECPICLKKAKFPFVFDACCHGFCRDCIVKYQSSQILGATRDVRHTDGASGLSEDGSYLGTKSGLPCPVCKSTETEDAEAVLYRNAKLLLGKADLPTTNNSQKSKLKDRALDCVRILVQAENVLTPLYLSNVIMLIDVGRYRDAIAAIGNLTDARFTTIRCIFMKAKALERNKKYAKALECYDKIMDENLANAEKYREPYYEVRLQCTAASAQCLYKTNNLGFAIITCFAGVVADRHYPGFNQYHALSLKKQGKLEEAMSCMARAVLYETPWNPNERHNAEVCKQYQEMCAKMDGSS